MSQAISLQAVTTTPRQNQRIIDLTLAGDDDALRQFSENSGLGIKAVQRRARKLGLTPRIVQGCRLAGTRPTLRDCLRCETQFLSRGRHNRLCTGCARRD